MAEESEGRQGLEKLGLYIYIYRFFGNFAFKWVGLGLGCVLLKLAPDLNSLRVLF